MRNDVGNFIKNYVRNYVKYDVRKYASDFFLPRSLNFIFFPVVFQYCVICVIGTKPDFSVLYDEL